MHCSRCGKKVPQSAERCPFCSETVLLADEPASSSPPPLTQAPSPELSQAGEASCPTMPRRSPWVLLALILITGGIYIAFWYRKVARVLNDLEGRKKFGSFSFWILLVGYSVYFFLSLVKGSNESLGVDTQGVESVSGVLWLMMTSFVIMVSLRMMETLKAWHERQGRSFVSNRIYTIILNTLYVQHKLNRM